jgi:hypothetical protein
MHREYINNGLYILCRLTETCYFACIEKIFLHYMYEYNDL